MTNQVSDELLKEFPTLIDALREIVGLRDAVAEQLDYMDHMSDIIEKYRIDLEDNVLLGNRIVSTLHALSVSGTSTDMDELSEAISLWQTTTHKKHINRKV